ncbi:unnamed protein product [Amoebophrya sp. A120]|nr:unnamed protein product [Amoebophrya sp. A120]|eukprot:GSA120T00017429001.1
MKQLPLGGEQEQLGGQQDGQQDALPPWEQRLQQLELLVHRQATEIAAQKAQIREQGAQLEVMRTTDARLENATSTTHADVSDLRKATVQKVRTIREVGTIVELVTQFLLAYDLALRKVDWIFSAVLLMLGYGAILFLIGIALPIKMVFFPETLILPKWEPPTLSTGSRPRGEGGARPLSEQDHREGEAVEQERDDGPVGSLELYVILPWDFFYAGTLSAVCQRAESSEGRVWTACLIVHTVCVLLSRYTLVIYNRVCSNFYWSWRSQEKGWEENTWEGIVGNTFNLDVIATEHLSHIAGRVLWLTLPSVCMFLTAAVPGASYLLDDEEGEDEKRLPHPRTDQGEVALSPMQLDGQHAERVAAGGSPVQVQDLAFTKMHLKKNYWFMSFIHLIVAPVGMATLLIFETLQFTGEGFGFGEALFGMSDEMTEGDWQFFFATPVGLAAAKCDDHSIMQRAMLQLFPTCYRLRAVCLVSGWICAVLFSALLMVLQAGNLGDRKSALFRDSTANKGNKNNIDEPAAHQDPQLRGRVVPKSASLLLPRAVFTFEILAMLFTFAMPFWPMITDVSRSLSGRGIGLKNTLGKDPFGTLDKQVDGIFFTVQSQRPMCGTFFDAVWRYEECNGVAPADRRWYAMTQEQRLPLGFFSELPVASDPLRGFGTSNYTFDKTLMK